jgi:hypothetical protein
MEENASGVCLDCQSAGAKEKQIFQAPRPQEKQWRALQPDGTSEDLDENSTTWECLHKNVGPLQVGENDIKHVSCETHDSESSSTESHNQDEVVRESNDSGFSSSFLKPLTNLLQSLLIRKRYQLPPPPSTDVNMGNLQGSDKNKAGPKNTAGSASPGRSRASKLLLGNRGKSPAKQQKNKTGATTAPSLVASSAGVTLPHGTEGGGGGATASSAAQVTTADHSRGSALLQQHLQTTAPSRESSAESVFTDPLTSPINNNNSATLAPASGSLTSSYYSDAGTLPRDDTMVRTALDTSPPEEEKSPMVDVDNVTLTLHESGSPRKQSLEALDEEEDTTTSDQQMTRSADELEHNSPPTIPSPTTSLPARTPSGGAFTLIRHRKVELPPATLPPEVAEYAQSELNLHGGELIT